MTKNGYSSSTIGILWKSGAEVFSGATPKNYLKRLAHLAYLSPNAGVLARWLRCEGNPALAREIHRSPVILHRLHRPYLHKDWSIPQRLEAIAQHYLALAEGPARLLDIAEEEYFDLVELDERYAGLRVVIDRPGWMRSEGEIAVSLFQDVHRIYAAMFILQGDAGNRRLLIGALQGAAGDHLKETYVKLTRLLHGARPRDFMVTVTKMLAERLGCREIWGLADANHRSEHKFVHIGKHASFDEVWLDNRGKINEAGFYVMDTGRKRRDPADIPPRKRALYRRRYQLLDSIEAEIRSLFSRGRCELKRHDPACLLGMHGPGGQTRA